MKNRMKKALALLVALVLTLSLLPAAAFAAEDVTVTRDAGDRGAGGELSVPRLVLCHQWRL